jgi:hypothetical protein
MNYENWKLEKFLRETEKQELERIAFDGYSPVLYF